MTQNLFFYFTGVLMETERRLSVVDEGPGNETTPLIVSVEENDENFDVDETTPPRITQPPDDNLHLVFSKLLHMIE